MKKVNKKEQFVIDNYQNMTQVQMAEELNITPSAIEYYMRKNNLKKKLHFSDYEIQFMKDNYQTMNYKEIAKILGYTERQIRGKINNMGLTKIRCINDNYFKSIDSPIKAYFLGFIYADGYVINNESHRNYEFSMELNSNDKYILDVLNEELGGDNLITHHYSKVTKIKGHIANKHDSDVLRVFSKKIVKDLMNHGISTNKTHSDVYPIVDDNLFFDFLRGYIDGDGCYWKCKNHYYMHITCANNYIFNYIQQKLNKYNIKTNIYQENENKYRLMCTNISSMAVLISLLYPNENVICLKRKYEKIKSYLIGSAA